MIKHENRILFLKEFTTHLILNSKEKPRIIPKKEIISVKPPESFQPSISTLFNQESGKFVKNIEIKPISLTNSINYSRLKPIIPAGFNKSLEPGKIEKISQKISFNFGKISSFINDYNINSIECPGPNKLIITKSNREYTTKVSLNENEIKEIIDFFSRDSGIPVSPGLFKANSGNLSITAVISEIVGSRFIITKITPSFSAEQFNQNYYE